MKERTKKRMSLLMNPVADPGIPFGGGGWWWWSRNETECQGNCREFWRVKFNI